MIVFYDQCFVTREFPQQLATDLCSFVLSFFYFKITVNFIHSSNDIFFILNDKDMFHNYFCYFSWPSGNPGFEPRSKDYLVVRRLNERYLAVTLRLLIESLDQ